MPTETLISRSAGCCRRPDLESLSLEARLIGVDRLYAVCIGSDTSPVHAKDTVILLDATPIDLVIIVERHGEQFAADTGARTLRDR